MIGQPTPITNKVPKIVVVFLVTIKILNSNKKYISTITMAPKSPYSSIIMAKIKSDED